MLSTRVTHTIEDISHFSVWGSLCFYFEDGEVNIKLTDEQLAELGRRATKEADERKQRKLDKLREELEELESETND